MATQASDSIKQKSRLTTVDELTVIVQRAQAFTNASGAAIAIGNSEEIVCRARSGSSAPDVGTSLRVEGSFTGLCIQTGRELRCDDAETDTRVDTTAIRALGIRSMVVTPIKDEGKVVGVLAVFAPTPHAFTITHVAVLKTMADQIAGLLQKERRTKDEPHVEAPVAPRPPVAVPTKPLPQPVVIKPSAAQPLAASVAAASGRGNGSAASVEVMRPVPVAVEIAPPVVVPKKEKKREPKHEPSPATKTSFGTLDAVAGEPKKRGANKFAMVGVVALLAVAGSTWAFVKMHKSASASAQTAQQSPAPAAQPVTTAAAVTPAPVPAAPSASVNSVPQNAKPTSADRPESKKTNDSEKNKPSPTATSPTTVALASGPSRISRGAADQSTDVAPSFAVGGSSDVTSSLARPEIG